MIIKCTCCKKEKSISEFNSHNGKRNKQCIQCREYFNNFWKDNPNRYQEKRKEYYQNNIEKHRLRNFKNSILKKYNLSLDRYNKMLKVQQNQCAICELIFNEKDLPCIDHCHQTNKVRGLLCRKCNLSLSYVESKFIEKAQRYLQANEIRDKEPL